MPKEKLFIGLYSHLPFERIMIDRPDDFPISYIRGSFKFKEKIFTLFGVHLTSPVGKYRTDLRNKQLASLAEEIQKGLKFMDALGVNSNNTPQLRSVQYYTSHEALLLPYEEALTRLDSTTGDTYNTSAHFLWVGDRTRFVDSAHIEFCRGIENPVGIKCGPNNDTESLLKIIDILNPLNESGKITLITRFGHNKVEKCLPKIIKALINESKNVIWSCDPMHGNTIKNNSGVKTRRFDNILSEVRSNIDIHKAEGSYLGGIHLEMTGQNVTECTGGLDKISDSDLSDRYRTHCDPRLNANQAIELAFLIADCLR